MKLAIRTFVGALLAALTLTLAAPAPANAGPVPQLLTNRDYYPGATVALDFVGARCPAVGHCYKAGGVTTRNFQGLPGLTVTRASGGYAEDQTGALTWFNSGQARITNKGLLVEESRTNVQLRSDPLGAVPGSPGSLPTGWSMGTATGLFNGVTRSIAGTGTDTSTGLPYVDISFVGTFTAAENVTVACGLTASTGTAATPGQAWTASQYWSVISGTLPAPFVSGINGTRIRYGSPGLLSQTGSSDTPRTTMGRASVTVTAPASTTIAGSDWLWSFNAGQAVNVTIRLEGFQLEQGAFATSYMPATTASATRAADFILLSGLNFTTPHTLGAAAYLPAADGIDRYLVLEQKNGTSAAVQQVHIRRTTTNTVRTNVTAGSTATSTDPFNGASGAITLNAAVTVEGPKYRTTAEGLPPVTFAGTLSPANDNDTLIIGSNNGVGQLNGYIQTVYLYPRSMSDGELQRLTAGPDTSSLNLNFASGTYRALVGSNVVQSTSLSNFATAAGYTLTATRSASAYAPDSTGRLIQFGPNVPRITDLGLLVEEARTNSFLQSQSFDNGAWAKSQATITADATVAPDGTLTADALVDTAANSTHEVNTNVTITANSTNAVAVYAKAGALPQLRVAFSTTYHVSSRAAVFNLSGCTVASADAGVSASGSVAANGWCRLAIVGTSNTGNTAVSVFIQPATGGSSTYVGTGAVAVYLWQADFQAGAFITSPISTTIATVTRPADVISLSGLSLNSASLTFGASGTYQNPANTTNQRLAVLSDGTTSNRWGLHRNTATQVNDFSVAAGSVVFQHSVARTGAVSARQVLSYDGTNYRSAIDAASGTPTAAASAGTLTRLDLGHQLNSEQGNVLIERILIYPYAANDNELQYRSAGNW